MNSFTLVSRKINLLFRRNQFRHELDEEMAFHREQAEKDFVASGMSPQAAHIVAARQFGNTTQLREQSHGFVAFRWETVAQDLRFALRQLRHNPGFAITAIFILALGMGVSVAIFGFVDAALIQPVPYYAPNRLMDVAERGTMFPRSNLSRADYEDWKRLNHSFTSLEAYGGTGFLLRTSSGSEPVPAARVTDTFFQTLGVKPMLGRDFRAGEDRPGGAKNRDGYYGTWQEDLAAAPTSSGQSLLLDGTNYTIVGVLPRNFEFAPRANAEFFVPLLDKNNCEQRRSCHNLFGIGRLRDGVTPKAALEDMKAIAAQLAIQYPGSNQDQGAVVQPLSQNHRRANSSGPAYLARRGRTAASDRVGQCRELAPRAVRIPSPRNCSARSSGSYIETTQPPVHHRRTSAGCRRKSRWSRSFHLDDVDPEKLDS